MQSCSQCLASLCLVVAVYLSSTGTDVVSAAEKPILDLHISDQISRLRSLGYEPSRLDDHTQLRVFLYTWLGMERGEGG